MPTYASIEDLPHVPEPGEVIAYELNALLLEGTPVRVKLTGFTMFKRKASLEEVGVPISEKQTLERFMPGRKKLLPQSYLGAIESLETRFRRNFRDHALSVQGFFPWGFMIGKRLPPDAPEALRQAEAAKPLGVFLKRHAELEQELEGVKQQLIDAHEALRAANAADFRESATKAYAAIVAREPGYDEDQESFVARIVAAADAAFPSPEDIQTTLKVQIRYGKIANQVALRKEQLALQEQELRVKMQAQEVDEAERRAAAIQLAELQQAHEEIANMASPYAEIIGQLGERLQEQIDTVLATIKQHGYLPGQSIERLDGIERLYNLFKIKELPELEAKLAELKVAMAPTSEKRIKGQSKYDVDGIKAKLIELSETVTKEMEHFGATRFSGFSAIEI